MFQIGEYVVHGNDGICEVKDITNGSRIDVDSINTGAMYYCG